MKSICLIVFMLLSSMFASAQSGGIQVGHDQGGGGDTCEKDLKVVAEDIKNWIIKGGAKDLELPENITHEYYSSVMLEGIAKARLSCTEDIITVYGAEKNCVNNYDALGVPYILCNKKSIKDTSIDDLYVLVHHEYAGLTKIENNEGPESDYSVSRQISAYLENQTIRRLVVRGDNQWPPFPSDNHEIKLSQILPSDAHWSGFIRWNVNKKSNIGFAFIATPLFNSGKAMLYIKNFNTGELVINKKLDRKFNFYNLQEAYTDVYTVTSSPDGSKILFHLLLHKLRGNVSSYVGTYLYVYDAKTGRQEERIDMSRVKWDGYYPSYETGDGPDSFYMQGKLHFALDFYYLGTNNQSFINIVEFDLKTKKTKLVQKIKYKSAAYYKSRVRFYRNLGKITYIDKDGDLVVIDYLDNWKTRTYGGWNHMGTMGNQSYPDGGIFSPDGKYLVSSKRVLLDPSNEDQLTYYLVLTNLETGEITKIEKHHLMSKIPDLEDNLIFHPTKDHIYFISYYGLVYKVDINKKEFVDVRREEKL